MNRYIVYLENSDGKTHEKIFFQVDDNHAYAWARQYCRDYNDMTGDGTWAFTYENLDEKMGLVEESNKENKKTLDDFFNNL